MLNKLRQKENLWYMNKREPLQNSVQTTSASINKPVKNAIRTSDPVFDPTLACWSVRS